MTAMRSGRGVIRFGPQGWQKQRARGRTNAHPNAQGRRQSAIHNRGCVDICADVAGSAIFAVKSAWRNGGLSVWVSS